MSLVMRLTNERHEQQDIDDAVAVESMSAGCLLCADSQEATDTFNAQRGCRRVATKAVRVGQFDNC